MPIIKVRDKYVVRTLGGDFLGEYRTRQEAVSHEQDYRASLLNPPIPEELPVEEKSLELSRPSILGRPRKSKLKK